MRQGALRKENEGRNPDPPCHEQQVSCARADSETIAQRAQNVQWVSFPSPGKPQSAFARDLKQESNLSGRNPMDAERATQSEVVALYGYKLSGLGCRCYIWRLNPHEVHASHDLRIGGNGA